MKKRIQLILVLITLLFSQGCIVRLQGETDVIPGTPVHIWITNVTFSQYPIASQFYAQFNIEVTYVNELPIPAQLLYQSEYTPPIFINYEFTDPNMTISGYQSVLEWIITKPLEPGNTTANFEIKVELSNISNTYPIGSYSLTHQNTPIVIDDKDMFINHPIDLQFAKVLVNDDITYVYGNFSFCNCNGWFLDQFPYYGNQVSSTNDFLIFGIFNYALSTFCIIILAKKRLQV